MEDDTHKITKITSSDTILKEEIPSLLFFLFSFTFNKVGKLGKIESTLFL